jgi:2-amino-4-hydroxy-6-hydroxymethyldihydropteridine diphosphokinase
MAKCLVSMGANLGDPSHALSKAGELLKQHPMLRSVRLSRNWRTSAVGGPAGQPDYFNAAVTCESDLDPIELLNLLQQIESTFHRQRDIRWGSRTLDLDLLLYDEQIIESPDLIVPHPRMAFRRFVLHPACEIAGDWLHPWIGVRLQSLLTKIESRKPSLVRKGSASDEHNPKLYSSRRIVMSSLEPRSKKNSGRNAIVERVWEKLSVIAAERWPLSISYAFKDGLREQNNFERRSMAFAGGALGDGEAILFECLESKGESDTELTLPKSADGVALLIGLSNEPLSANPWRGLLPWRPWVMANGMPVFAVSKVDPDVCVEEIVAAVQALTADSRCQIEPN